MSDPYDQGVTWMVPCRRLVVKEKITYQTLLNRWLACLSHQPFGNKLKSWYGIADKDYLVGIAALANAVAGWTTTAVPVARRESAVDTGRDFQVRLWKGPLRVLLEEKQALSPKTPPASPTGPSPAPPAPPGPTSGPAPAGGPGAAPAPAPAPAPSSGSSAKAGASAGGGSDASTFEIEYGGKTLKLKLNDNKEVVNRDALFLMGDVVEFPLFTFLEVCGKNDYADLQFDPMGSFLCGSAVKSKGGAERYPYSAPLLHDNLIAMRLQFILNLLRGAFYDLQRTYSDKVGEKAVPVGVDPGGSDKIYARGIMYGAEMGSPRGDQEFYRLYSGEWGYVGESAKQKYAGNVPIQGDEGINKLYVSSDAKDVQRSDPPLTSGVSCSPATLFMMFYLHNEFGWGHSSVNDEFGRKDSRLRKPQDWLKKFAASDYLTDEEAQQEKDAGDCNKKLDDKIKSITNYHVATPLFWMEAVRKEAARKPGPKLSTAAAGYLNKAGKSDPPRMLTEVKSLMAKADNGELLAKQSLEDDKTPLANVAQAITDTLNKWKTELKELKEDPCWQTLSLTPPDYALPSDPPTSAEWQAIRQSLTTKSPGKIAYKKGELASLKGFVAKDMSTLFADFTVFAYPHHELGLIKLQRFEQLMSRNELPLSMAPGGYDPLSGEELVSPAMAATGQLWHYEAGSWLPQWLDEKDNTLYQAPGISPFRWRIVPGNHLYLQKVGKDSVYCSDNTFSGADGVLQASYTTKMDWLRARYPRWKDGDAGLETKVYKPIAISALKPKPDGDILRRFEVEQSKQKDSVREMVSQRAVPFPTMTETAEKFNFPRLSEVKSNAKKLAEKLKADIADFDTRKDSYLKTLKWLKDSGYLTRVDAGAETVIKYLVDKSGLEKKGVSLLSDARPLRRFVAAVTKLGVAGLEKKLGTDKEAPTDTESKASKFFKRVTDGSDSVNGMMHDLFTLATLTNVHNSKSRSISFADALDPDWVKTLPELPAR